VQWVPTFVKWHGLRHPRDMGHVAIERFLGMLANERRVAAATHNHALSALLFLYREVLGINLPWLDAVQRPRTPKRIPSVLTVAEAAALLSALPTDMALLARLLYGTGMRLVEGLRLRIKDVDFDRGVIVVRQAKGNKDRVVMPPHSLAHDLRKQVLAARAEESRDTGGHLQACLGTYLAPQLRHALVAVGHRHSHGAGAAGAFGREHDDDLHPCPESRSRRNLQPVGLIGLALTAWLNDSFGAFIWMAAQGRHKSFAAHRSGRSSRCTASSAVERPVPRVKRPYRTGGVLRLKAPLLTEEHQKELDEFLARLFPRT